MIANLGSPPFPGKALHLNEDQEELLVASTPRSGVMCLFDRVPLHQANVFAGGGGGGGVVYRPPPLDTLGFH